jgi:DNA modification methylase
MTSLSVEHRSPSELKPYCRNARTHSPKQIAEIAASIKAFGFNNPVLIDKADGIVAGHGRVEAAKLLGLPTVPTIRLEHLTEVQKRAYILADNKLAEKAGWDREILAIELQNLMELELEFDISATGFELPEIDVLIDELKEKPAKADPADEVPLVEGPPVTRLGDIWQIGPHRLICGDSTAPENYVLLLAGEKAQLVFTDPPYNVPIEGHVSGLGAVKHREFAMASGEMTEAEFTTFLAKIFDNLIEVSVDGAIHFICMDWRHIGEVMAAACGRYADFKNLCVWAKTNGGMGSLYRSQHELVCAFKVGTAPHINNVELGKHGRYRTNVWTYAGANAFGATRDEDLASHPTVKPVALVADAILDCSIRRSIVLDAFAGSGTTLVAAHKTGRRGYGIELDPLYCDVILKRLTKIAKIEAVLSATGQTFSEVARERQVGSEQLTREETAT